MARKKPTSVNLTDQSVALAEYTAQALVLAERLAIKKKIVKRFPLDETDRAIAAKLPVITPTLKKKLANPAGTFTIAETGSIVMAVAESLLDGQPQEKLKRIAIAQKLLNCLQDNVVPLAPVKARKQKPTATVFQFKITLLDAKPPIWRRIQVQDCTLDKFHEHIQTAMGWTNSHLHHFRVGEQLYGDPALRWENMDELGYEDSTTIMLSDIVPKGGKRFRFLYEYDFGDSWNHEVLFEGHPKAEVGGKYPQCSEGQRACPPEDCGGVWGYVDFLDAICDEEHELHEELLDWIGGSFDPEAFDPVSATKAMKKGLPDLRKRM